MSLDVNSAITQMYRLCGVIGNDEAAEGDQPSTGLTQLNDALGQLNLMQMFPFSRVIKKFDITSSKESYTIGLDSADIDAQRPVFIQSIQYYPSMSSASFPLQSLDINELLGIRNPNTTTGSPDYFSLVKDVPNSSIYFNVKPSGGSSILLTYNREIPQVSLGDVLSVPNEYNELIITAGSFRVGIYEQVSDSALNRVKNLYDSALARVTRSNGRSQNLHSIRSRNSRSNIITGRNSWR